MRKMYLKPYTCQYRSVEKLHITVPPPQCIILKFDSVSIYANKYFFSTMGYFFNYQSVYLFLIRLAIISYKQKQNYQIINCIKQEHKADRISNSEIKCKSTCDITQFYIISFMFVQVHLTKNSFLYGQLFYMVPNPAASLQSRSCWMLSTLKHLMLYWEKRSQKFGCNDRNGCI